MIGANLDLLSGRGKGIPGGGSGCPRPMGWFRSTAELDWEAEPGLAWSFCLCRAFQPQFFACAAALVTTASVLRFDVLSLFVDALEAELDEVSRRKKPLASDPVWLCSIPFPTWDGGTALTLPSRGAESEDEPLPTCP